jgi:hypothetical protein
LKLFQALVPGLLVCLPGKVGLERSGWVEGVGVSWLGYGGRGCSICRMVSKILFGYIVLLSLRWFWAAASLWLWNYSSVFKCGPFFWCRIICMIDLIGPKGCACSLRCLAKSDESLLLRKACLCSLYLTENFLPLWPIYALLHSGQMSLYTPEKEHCSLWGWVWFVSRLSTELFVR